MLHKACLEEDVQAGTFASDPFVAVADPADQLGDGALAQEGFDMVQLSRRE